MGLQIVFIKKFNGKCFELSFFLEKNCHSTCYICKFHCIALKIAGLYLYIQKYSEKMKYIYFGCEPDLLHSIYKLIASAFLPLCVLSVSK